MAISSTTRKTAVFIGNDTSVVFPFTFKVFTAADLEVVRLQVSTSVETVLVITTNYTVSLNTDQESNPGGSITLLVALAVGQNLVITSTIAILQPTDLQNQGGFFPNVIDDSLDRITIIAQQLQEQVDRSAKLPITSAEDADALVADIVRLADSAANIDTVAGSITNVNTVATNIANVNTVAGISGNVTTVAGISGNVTTVAGISANTTTVAGIAANVTTVAGVASNVTTVATNITNVNAVGADLLEPTSEINTVAVDIANVNTVGLAIANVNTVAGIAADVTTVAGISANVTTVAGVAANVTTNATNIASINTNAANITAIQGASANAAAAATSAAGAVSSANAAAGSAAAAASSQTAAAASATSAAASYDSFDDRYLGAKASPPTLDNDGNALIDGALYFDTTLALMRVYNLATTAWISITVASITSVSDQANTSTGWLDLPVGTTAQRGSPTSGAIRYNSSLSAAELYNGTAWASVGGGATGAGGDTVFQENQLIVTTSYTLSTGKSASSVGPIQINGGATVSIPSGYRWLIL